MKRQRAYRGVKFTGCSLILRAEGNEFGYFVFETANPSHFENWQRLEKLCLRGSSDLLRFEVNN